MSSTIERFARGRVAPREYNSRLQKCGALLQDMRILVRRWTDAGAHGQRDEMILENLLGKNKRSRAADTFYARLGRLQSLAHEAK